MDTLFYYCKDDDYKPYKENFKMTYLGEDIKKLGFGMMRLPKIGDSDAIDIEQSKVMVDKFMAAGFTYFDTAWAYRGSEDALRQTLVERYPRESFQIATKNAAWINCKSREDAISQFETSLRQTGAGYFDFYLLHNLGEKRTQVFEDFNMWQFVLEQKAAGKIRHIGFSFHAMPEELDAILIAHPEAEFVQLQVNYADWNDPSIQSRRCYEVARKYDKPVIIMEPVKGGMLATPPESVAEILKKAEPNASCASWAIRFAADLDGIITVLSGMSNIAQMDDNIAHMKDFKGLTDAQKSTIQEAQRVLSTFPLIPCTSCHYCAKVCPRDIGIAGTFAAMNVFTLYGDKAAADRQIGWFVKGRDRKLASECIQCGKCETVCPQHISIREKLKEAVKALL